MTASEEIEKLIGEMTPDNVDDVVRRAGLVEVDDDAAMALEGLVMRAEALRSPEGRAAWEAQEKERRDVEDLLRRHGR